MAFGFPASYTASVELSGDRQNARETVRSIFDLLGWRYTERHGDLFTAAVPFSAGSWGEKITVTFEPPGVLRIRSSCSFPQIFDWGKNKQNVESFIERFALREFRSARMSEEPEYFDDQGKTPLDRALASGSSSIARDESPHRSDIQSEIRKQK